MTQRLLKLCNIAQKAYISWTIPLLPRWLFLQNVECQPSITRAIVIINAKVYPPLRRCKRSARIDYMFLTFLIEYGWVLGALCMFTLMGSFLTALYDFSKNYILAAPLGGILILSLGTSAFYIFAGLPLKTSSLVTILFSSSSFFLITLYFYPPKFKNSDFIKRLGRNIPTLARFFI